MANLTRRLRYPFETPPPEGEVIKVATGILWARLPLPMALDHVNVYILDGDDGWTIVDTGFNSRRSRGIWQKLLDGPVAGTPVARVLRNNESFSSARTIRSIFRESAKFCQPCGGKISSAIPVTFTRSGGLPMYPIGGTEISDDALPPNTGRS